MIAPDEDICSGIDIGLLRLVECDGSCVPRQFCTEAYMFSYSVRTAGEYYLRLFVDGYPLL